MEVMSSKQKEEFKATIFVINILRLQTNPKVLIQGFVWSFEILITNVLPLTYSIYFDYIMSMSVPFKKHLFCQIRCITAELSTLKVEQYPIHVIIAAISPHPRWRRKPCNGLLEPKKWVQSRLIENH